MAKQTGKQAKPKCGAGQSCGYACIAAHETCTETLDPSISKAAVEALRGHATAASAAVASESTDFRGKSFAEVQSKFSANDAKHTIMSTIVDHGEGITTQKVTLVASDGSGDTLTHTLLRMAAVPASEGGEAQPERIFTLADGTAKEYTDASKNNFWNESRDAAVRAAISRLEDAKNLSAEKDFAPVLPYSEVKTLGQGSYGKAVLTDRGTVVKTSTLDQSANSEGTGTFDYEALMQARAAVAGLAPKVLGLSPDKLEQGLAAGDTVTNLKDKSGTSKKGLEEDANINSKVGDAILRLHAAGIAHNDLHGGNAIIDGDKVTFIDFATSNGTGDAEYLMKGTRVEEFIKRSREFANPAVLSIKKTLATKIESYNDAKRAGFVLGTDNRTEAEKKSAETNRLASLKSLDDAYENELTSHFSATEPKAAEPEPKAAEPEPKAAEPEPKAADKPPAAAKPEAEPDGEAATSKAKDEAIKILGTAAPGDRKKNGWDEDDFVRMFDPQRNPKAAEYWNELQSKDSPAAVRKVQKAWDERGMKGDNGIKDNTLVELPKLVMMNKQTDKARTPEEIRQDRIMNVTNSDGVKTARKAK